MQIAQSYILMGRGFAKIKNINYVEKSKDSSDGLQNSDVWKITLFE